MIYKRRKPLFVPAAALLLLSGMLSGCSGTGTGAQASERPADPKSQSYFIFDTIVTVKVFDEGVTNRQFDDIRKQLEEIDVKMSRNVETSEISKVNRNAGKTAVTVSSDTFGVVAEALRYAELSKGKFDPTVGPLVDSWQIGSDSAKRLKQPEIDGALKLIDYKSVTLDEASKSIKLEKAGMSLDLGAIAKGYAADVIAAYLKEQGFQSAIIDLGGNILAMGEKPGGKPWAIGIQDPESARGESIGSVRIVDQTVVSSGVYERFFIEDGVRYHHIFDTETGYPADNGLMSVTIITDRSEQADALSTSVFAMGLEDGMKFVEKLGYAEAVFITSEKEVFVSSGLKDKLTFTASDYKLME